MNHTTKLVGAALFGAAFLIYWLGMQTWYTGDDLQYATVIERAVTGKVFYHPSGEQVYVPESAQAIAPTSLPLNPRYPLEWLTSIAFVEVCRFLGWQGKVIAPILILRAGVGALGLFSFFWSVRRLTQHTGVALIATIGVGASTAYWTYSTHLDQSINMIACVSAAFYCLLRHFDAPRSRWRWAMVGMLILATLYNFTAALSALVFILASVAAESAPWRAKFSTLIRRGLIYGVSTLAALALCIIIFVSPASLTSSEFWKSATFQGHPEYEVDPARDAVRGALGFAKSQINMPGAEGSLQAYWDRAATWDRIRLAGYYGALLALMAIPVSIIILYRREARQHKWLAGVIAGWMIIHAAFNWIWDPGYIKYWILPLMGWWMFAGLAVVMLAHRAPRVHRIAIAAILVFGVATCGVNLLTQFLPQSRPDSNPWLTAIAHVQTAPNALFISSGHPLDFYITYFAERDLLSVPLLIYGFGGDANKVKQMIAAHQTAHRADNGALYVFGFDAQNESTRKEFLNRVGARELQPAFTFPDLVIYQVVR